jgi:hypothetical protein
VLCEQAGRPDDAAEYFAALSHGSDGYYYGIDAWAYVKAMRGPNTRLTGPTAQGLQYALAQARVEGLVLEFGVRFGATLNLIAAQAAQTVHGFDSFEGLPENWHGEPAGSYSTGGHKPRVAGNAVLHAGWFKDTLPAFVAAHREPVRFMHIDCDLYSSTATVFRHMGPRVRAGSIIVLDDYFANADWREDEFKAFREAASEYRWTYEYIVFSLYAKQAAVRILSVGT